MKKLMKFSKALLLIATIFSYVSSPIAVLADEITSKPLNILLAAIDEDDDGYIDNYELTCKSLNSEYDEDKTYEVKLETVFTYNDETTDSKTYEILVSGEVLNSENGSSFVLDPISRYYNGIYNLSITVYDGETVIYEDSNYVYNYNTLVGLTGKLNEIEATTEVVGSNSVGNYDVTDEGEYTQHLSVLTGELSPNGKYRVVYDDNTYSEVMTGEELRNSTFAGTVTDLTGKLFGTYSYTDVVAFEEVTENDSMYEVVNTYTYNYNANIAYGTDNDELFSNLYGITFENGYMIVNAKGLYGTEEVITLGELLDTLNGSDISLEVLDEEENVLDLTLEEVLAMEVKNNYRVRFTNGATAEYVVVVKGDTTSDNEFTSDDLTGVMEGYLGDENMPSMDMVTLEEEVVDENGEVTTKREEFGTITFEDVMFTNELLKEDGDTEKEVEDNTSLVLEFGQLPEEVFVGDTISLDVLVRSDNDLDYIDGIDGVITTSDNLRLAGIESSDTFNGVYDDETGRLVGAGLPLTNGTVVMTLVFDVVGDGTGNITLSGKTAKYLNISDFDTMTKELALTRNVSTNNNLSSLKASVGTFDVAFDKDVTVYTLTVPYDTESVILSGELEDVYASVDGLVEYKLAEDKMTAIVTVTAEDGSVKTYTIYIVKEAKPVTTPVVYYYSSNNYLKSLEIDGYEIEFNKDTNEYKIKVKSDVTSLDIKALSEDSRSRVEITGNENFKEGENTVTITVTAEDGTIREYKLVVDKEEKKQAAVTTDDSNTAEKVVIVILIILVVLGLLYLIFKKDDEEKKEVPVKKEEPKDNKNSVNKNINTNKNSSKNKKK